MEVEFLGTNFDYENIIAQAARVSYQQGVKKHSDLHLIRRLYHDLHTSPFEHIVLTFRAKVPISIARQIERHRTHHLNTAFSEQSLRFSVAKDGYFTPDVFRTQHKLNKQMSDHPVTDDIAEYADEKYRDACDKAFNVYQDLLDAGVCREQARFVLPMGTYTRLFWTSNLKNFIHYVMLREADDAQAEHQYVAREIGKKLFEMYPNVMHFVYHPDQYNDDLELREEFFDVAPKEIDRSRKRKNQRKKEKPAEQFGE